MADPGHTYPNGYDNVDFANLLFYMMINRLIGALLISKLIFPLNLQIIGVQNNKLIFLSLYYKNVYCGDTKD